jgi:hypothetical protein
MRGRVLFIRIPLILFFCLLLPKTSYAYLDPGIGSYLIQIAIGFLVGAMFAFKLYWRKIKAFIKKLFLYNKTLGNHED